MSVLRLELADKAIELVGAARLPVIGVQDAPRLFHRRACAWRSPPSIGARLYRPARNIFPHTKQTQRRLPHAAVAVLVDEATPVGQLAVDDADRSPLGAAVDGAGLPHDEAFRTSPAPHSGHFGIAGGVLGKLGVRGSRGSSKKLRRVSAIYAERLRIDCSTN